MPNLYVADDGTIRDRDLERASPQPNRHTARTAPRPHHDISFKSCAYWVISLLCAVIVARLLYHAFGYAFFRPMASPNNLVEHVGNFFCTISPVLVPVGAMIGSILCGKNYAAYEDYHFGTYIASLFAAALGAVAIAISTLLLTLVLSLFLYIIFAILLISIVASILGG